MTRLAHVLLTAAFTLALVGCSRSAAPEQVVDRYFARLARDPLGTLPLLSDAFHAEHGLRVTTRKRAAALRSGQGDEGVPGAPQEMSTPGELSRARLGWVAIQKRDPVRRLAPELAVETLSARQDGDRAEVVVRVSAPSLPAFVQRFALSRSGPTAAWRIDRVRQEEVAPSSRLPAMAALPSRERLLEILRAGP